MRTVFLIFILIFIGYVSCVFSIPQSSIEMYEESELHSAIRAKNVSLFQEAVESQGNLHVRNSRGQSPLVLAILLSQTDMVKGLLERGAALDFENQVDQDAFKYARRSVKKILKKYNQKKSFCWRFFKK